MSATESRNSLLLDPKLWNFFEQLISGKIKEINPQYDSANAFGYRYPEVERLLEMDIAQTIDTLNILHNAGILERDFFNYIFKCPNCESIHVHYQQSCQLCGSTNVKLIELIEHLTCGYIGPSKEITLKKGVHCCPQCGEMFKEEKVDYRISKGIYCESCKRITPKTDLHFICFDCNKTIKQDELKSVEIFKYRLNMDMRGDLVKVLSYRPILPREVPSRKRKKKQDSLDIRILNIMQIDARTSYREIARRTGVSDATVRDRVNKMIEKGWIEGFTTIVNPAKVGKNVTCLMNLKIDPQDFQNIISQLKDIKEIKMIFELTEKNSIIIMVVLEDKEELRQFINETIYQIPGIEVEKVNNIINIAKNDPRLYL
ncbi:MAG: AsnC family transcriptional regulator [Candidatus Helarchaeota archaeon]